MTTMRYDDLCLLCLRAVNYMSSQLIVYQEQVTATPDEPIVLRDMQITGGIYKGQQSLCHMILGRPGAFADLVRLLGDDPSVRWVINGLRVRVFAEVNVFGLQVCASHVDDAMELWKSGSRGLW